MQRGRLHAIFVPDLLSDNFLSMDLYAEDIKQALASITTHDDYSHFSWEMLAITSSIGDGRIKRLWQKLWVMPRLINERVREMKRSGAKVVVHILDHSYGHLIRRNIPTFITCHDLANHRMNIRSKHYTWLSHLFWTYKVHRMRRAAGIFCISDNTRHDVHEILGVDEKFTCLNYYGHDEFFSSSSNGTAFLDTSSGSLIKEAASNGTLIMHCGHNNQRKNIPTLLRAFKLIKDKVPGAILVKVGHKMLEEDPSLIDLTRSLGIEHNLIETGIIDKPTLRWLYHNSDLFIYPSIYEGFGRPLLEAQASGLPIVCADSSCLKEVAGRAAIFCSTLNHDEFATNALKLLSDEELRTSLIAEGKCNIKRFSWRNHVLSFIEKYDDSLSGNSR